MEIRSQVKTSQSSHHPHDPHHRHDTKPHHKPTGRQRPHCRIVPLRLGGCSVRLLFVSSTGRNTFWTKRLGRDLFPVGNGIGIPFLGQRVPPGGDKRSVLNKLAWCNVGL